MSDTTTTWNPATGYADWTLVGAQLQSGGDLYTAILISLFTDRIANPEDVIPDGTNDPRGWIGDAGEDYPIGSRLWLLSRAKATQGNVNLAREYCIEALQWLIDDGVVASFDINCQLATPTMLAIRIVAHKPDGAADTMNYSWAWNAI